MKIRKLVIAVAISISAPLCAQAGIMGDLNSMFMSNSTAAGTMKTKDRVGIFAGSVSMRAPIKSVTIIAFDAPRLNAGCGGVDLFGGSFSFINSQQLVQIFRQVAANAAGLAFKAAIKAISPSLDALMTEFQALMQNLNNLAKNSCQMAHMIIDHRPRPDHHHVHDVLWRQRRQIYLHSCTHDGLAAPGHQHRCGACQRNDVRRGCQLSCFGHQRRLLVAIIGTGGIQQIQPPNWHRLTHHGQPPNPDEHDFRFGRVKRLCFSGKQDGTDLYTGRRRHNARRSVSLPNPSKLKHGHIGTRIGLQRPFGNRGD